MKKYPCIKCAKEKEAADFYFIKKTNYRRKICKECNNLQSKLRKRKNPERNYKMFKKWQANCLSNGKCISCGQKNNNGLKKCEKCRIKIAKYKKKHSQKNKEYQKKYNKEYYKRNKEKIKEYQGKKYRKKCTKCAEEKLKSEFSGKKAECKNCSYQRTKDWRKKNQKKLYDLNEKRRKKLLSQGKCQICGKSKEENFTKCKKCRAKKAKYANDYYHRNRIKILKKMKEKR